MKKINLIFILFLSISLVVFNSCDSDDSNLKNETIISAGQYEFDLGINVNTTGSIDIPVFINNISGSDRTFNLTIAEGSTGSSADYTVPTSVTIPANGNEGTLTIDSNDVTNTLILEIEEQPGIYAAEDIIINILKVCPVDENTFAGASTVVADDWADYAIGDTVTILPGSNVNEIYVTAQENPYISNSATAHMIVSFDPDTFVATVELNELYLYGFDTIDIVGTGFVDPCTGEVNLTLNFLQASSGGAYATDQSFILQL